MSILGLSLPTKILVALNVVIGIAMIVWVVGSLRVEQESLPPSDDAFSDSSPIVPKMIRTDALEAHPLFNSTRMPVDVEPSPDSPDQTTLQAPPLLVGILRGGDSRLGVLLEDTQSGIRKFVRPNELFGAWTLVSLRPKFVVLRSGSQEIELQLSFDSRSPATPGATDPIHRNP